jgi:hypothetical protein
VINAKQFPLVADELALVEVADSPLLTTPNLPKMQPIIARYCTLVLQSMSDLVAR